VGDQREKREPNKTHAAQINKGQTHINRLQRFEHKHTSKRYQALINTHCSSSRIPEINGSCPLHLPSTHLPRKQAPECRHTTEAQIPASTSKYYIWLMHTFHLLLKCHPVMRSLTYVLMSSIAAYIRIKPIRFHRNLLLAMTFS